MFLTADVWFWCCWISKKTSSIFLRVIRLDSCFEMSMCGEEKGPECINSSRSEAHTHNYTQHIHIIRACKEEITMSVTLLRLCAGVSNLHKKACVYLCVSRTNTYCERARSCNRIGRGRVGYLQVCTQISFQTDRRKYHVCSSSTTPHLDCWQE